MLKEFNTYIETTKKERAEFIIRSRFMVDCLENFLEVLEKNAHHQKVTKRITDQYKGHGTFQMGNFYGSGHALHFYAHHNNEWVQQKVLIHNGLLGETTPTPHLVIEKIKEDIVRWKANDYECKFERMHAFFEEISEVCEKHGKSLTHDLLMTDWRRVY